MALRTTLICDGCAAEWETSGDIYDAQSEAEQEGWEFEFPGDDQAQCDACVAAAKESSDEDDYS